MIFGLLVNLITPWNAPWSFYKRRVYLKRPPGITPTLFEIDRSDSSVFIPKHLLCSHFLFVVGGCNSLFCSLFFGNYMRIVAENYEREVEEDTQKFYQEQYGCQSFDQLLNSTNNDSSGIYQPSHVTHSQSARYQEQPVEAVAIPIDSNQQYTYVEVARDIPSRNKL